MKYTVHIPLDSDINGSNFSSSRRMVDFSEASHWYRRADLVLVGEVRVYGRLVGLELFDPWHSVLRILNILAKAYKFVKTSKYA
jgi:hypothetical protein